MCNQLRFIADTSRGITTGIDSYPLADEAGDDGPGRPSGDTNWLDLTDL